MVTNQISAFVLGTHWVARVCILLVVVPVRRVRDTCSTGLKVSCSVMLAVLVHLSLSLSLSHSLSTAISTTISFTRAKWQKIPNTSLVTKRQQSPIQEARPILRHGPFFCSVGCCFFCSCYVDYYFFFVLLLGFLHV